MVYLQEHVYLTLLVFSFLMGSAVGSFLNVFILRTVRGMSLVHPPSHCFSCGNQLSLIIDNIPIFGWFLLKGKCRYCGTTYNARYALNEFLFACATVAIFLFSIQDKHLNLWVFAPIFVLFALLFSIAYIDRDYQRIPDKITIPSITLFLIFAVFQNANPQIAHLKNATVFQSQLYTIALGLYLVYFLFTHTESDFRKTRIFHLLCVTINFALALFLCFFAHKFDLQTSYFWDKAQAIVYLGGGAYILSVAPKAFGLNSFLIGEGDAKLIILIAAALGLEPTINVIQLWIFVFIVFSPLSLLGKMAKDETKKKLQIFGVILTISSAILFFNAYFIKLNSVFIYACLALFATSGVFYFLNIKKCVDRKVIPDRIHMAPLVCWAFIFWIIFTQVKL